jgi:hypothetical protein
MEEVARFDTEPADVVVIAIAGMTPMRAGYLGFQA